MAGNLLIRRAGEQLKESLAALVACEKVLGIQTRLSDA
jgi:hypothetical protein